ncbi:hypothetical protein PVK06_033539 [Gossypium arboreum]|uniref:Uncharacterized protein n=1 Tax=Gossypium arboreum TaxID=29729 RepID=A0ABR0NBN7_GOSAR|nr:hypothetical protein PVK06_033539 [Gossypium arboreum]
MNHFPYCEHCVAILESALHAVRDCSSAQSIWKAVLPVKFWRCFFSLSRKKWITWNLKNEETMSFLTGRMGIPVILFLPQSLGLNPCKLEVQIDDGHALLCC